jgi:hypothetical protein
MEWPCLGDGNGPRVVRHPMTPRSGGWSMHPKTLRSVRWLTSFSVLKGHAVCARPIGAGAFDAPTTSSPLRTWSVEARGGQGSCALCGQGEEWSRRAVACWSTRNAT